MTGNKLSEMDAEIEREDELYRRGMELQWELDHIDQQDAVSMDYFFGDFTEFDKEALEYYGEKQAERREQEKQAAQTAAQSVKAVPKNPQKLSTLLDKYMKFNTKTREDAWSTKSAKKFRGQITLFIQMLDDPYAHDLTKPMVRDMFGDLICELPIRMNLTKRYFNGGNIKLENRKPIDEIIAIAEEDEDKTLSPKTIVDYVNVVKGFLLWLNDEDYTDHDMGVVLKRLSELAKNQEEKEKKFTTEDLQKLFETDAYRKGLLMEDPHLQWAPLIGLFTGARLGEICQLNLDDVIYDEECETWVIEFKPGGDKRLKNKYSERVTP